MCVGRILDKHKSQGHPYFDLCYVETGGLLLVNYRSSISLFTPACFLLNKLVKRRVYYVAGVMTHDATDDVCLSYKARICNI